MCHYHYSEQCAIFFKTLIKVSSLLTYLEVLFTITLFSLLYDNIECLSFLFVSGLAQHVGHVGPDCVQLYCCAYCTALCPGPVSLPVINSIPRTL